MLHVGVNPLLKPLSRSYAAQPLVGSNVMADDLMQYELSALPNYAPWAILRSLIDPITARVIANTNETRVAIQARDFVLPEPTSGNALLREADKAIEAVT